MTQTRGSMNHWLMLGVLALAMGSANPALAAKKKAAKGGKQDAKQEAKTEAAKPETKAVAAPAGEPQAAPAAKAQERSANNPPPVEHAADKAAEKVADKAPEKTAPERSAPERGAEKAPEKAAAATPPTAVKDDLDFDLLEKKEAPSQFELEQAEETERAARLRRSMLLAHQIIGYTLMASMTVTTVLGTLNYYDKFGGGGFTERYRTAHLVSSMVSTGAFATNGLLALFTPDPYDKPGKWDSARAHRIIMASATAGMVAQVVLGFISAARLGNLDQRDFARTHLAVGYVTYALTMAGGLVYLF